MLSDKYYDCGAGVAVSGETIYYCFDAARPISGGTPHKTPETTPSPTDGYIVYVPRSLAVGLRLRKHGSLAGDLIRVVAPGEWLAVEEPGAIAKAKVGVENQWLKVKDSKGNVGYVAAWLVRENDE